MKQIAMFFLTLLTAMPAHGAEEIFSVVTENDLYGGNSDRHYTNGFRASWLSTDFQVPDWLHNAANNNPLFRFGENTGVMYSIGQNIYTPTDITIAADQPGERPWAGYTYASAALTSGDDTQIDMMEVSLGIVGPQAYGEEVQKFVHQNISNSPEPKGWDNQLKNEPALNLAWERRWPKLWEGINLGPLNGNISPHISTQLGNVYTTAGVGAMVTLAPNNGVVADFPLRVRPALPGTTYYDRAKPFNWMLFAGFEWRYVHHNIFLNGNTVANSPHVRNRPFVLDSQAGVSMTYKNARVSYTVVHRTKEFYGQAKTDIFGAVSLSLRF